MPDEMDDKRRSSFPPGSPWIAVLKNAFAGGATSAALILAFAAPAPTWARISAAAVFTLIVISAVSYSLGFHHGARSAGGLRSRS